ncbi:MAG: N-formylglutamate amidohydrolase [Deltaproteobacteria bacterium]|nr:N-formylglutamate amidohydrolase [Deltaproteobacteria bacterium]
MIREPRGPVKKRPAPRPAIGGGRDRSVDGATTFAATLARVDAFEVVEPEEDSPVVVEIPHAGLALDPPTLSWIVAPARCIARDADLYVDRLYADAPRLGATVLRSKLSRYVVDLNRADTDYDGQTVDGGSTADRPRGVVWRLTSEGYPVLRERMPRAELDRRLERFWRPYHATLGTLLEQKRRQFGFAVLICAHSMPTPRTRGLRSLMPGTVADVVPGTRGRTSAAARWIDAVDGVARAHGFGVEHDVPYRGGFSTGHYGRPAEGVHAVQVEVARRLYMDEEALELVAAGAARLTAFAGALVERLVTDARAVHRSDSGGSAP